jgi:DNA-binding HxlR family transcriptional regulator
MTTPCSHQRDNYKSICRFSCGKCQGLISKKIYPEIPPKVEYRITPQARELESILREMGKWASRWKSPQLQKTKLQ